MYKVRPKKNFGQHFLTDEHIASRIADTLDSYANLPVLEVGPGMGMLTKHLIAKGFDLTVIEIDRESVKYLKENYPELEGNIIEQDFLKINLSQLYDNDFCVIGNYPYNISSQIFFKIIDNKDHIPCCSGMIQKEVAERLAAPPGSKTYGILSILIQTWYDIEYLFTVGEGSFNPPPKVKSAVVRLTRNGRTKLNCDEQLFKSIVKTVFNQRRKMMRNSLKALLPPDTSPPDDPIFTKRPEQLSIQQFESLTNLLEPIIKKID
ncbi:MAG: 16S rRNA (adenine(1518)-N(6)/adenine(1519)-N(6))-dimethyltransferase RsmA [Fermentimonas sp.]|jgi:16S rRNA (adenine1518-N6/adenine1519-N6)-dimethyltransferase